MQNFYLLTSFYLGGGLRNTNFPLLLPSVQLYALYLVDKCWEACSGGIGHTVRAISSIVCPWLHRLPKAMVNSAIQKFSWKWWPKGFASSLCISLYLALYILSANPLKQFAEPTLMLLIDLDLICFQNAFGYMQLTKYSNSLWSIHIV